jgi:SAM-dependent methyltransferase
MADYREIGVRAISLEIARCRLHVSQIRSNCRYRSRRRMRNPLVAPTISQAFLGSNDKQSVPDEEVFPFLRLPNGTFKTTEAHRMADVDERLAAILGNEPRDYDILDAACSSGTCTTELAEALTRHGIRHRLFASDLYLHALRLSLPPFAILYCKDRFILQADFARYAFPNTPPSRLSAFIFAIARWLIGAGRAVGLHGVPAPLLSSAARHSAVQFSDGDVFGELYQADPALRFDVIRVANLLHTSYFTESEIKRAIANVKLHLRPGGLLVLARSEDKINTASIYRLRESTWELVDHLHDNDEYAQWMNGPPEREGSPKP